MDEFDFIRDLLAPLAGPEGLRLEDDAACFTPKDGFDLVITKDAMVEGVHFPNGHYGGNIAEKLLRVNLSDLAAKGARPLGYFLSLSVPETINKAQLHDFTSGLRAVQQIYDFTLWGGDTVSGSDKFVISATFIGQIPKDRMVQRSGAKPGDDVWVTGDIGDAYLGVQCALETPPAPLADAKHKNYWLERYFRPEPRLLFRKALIDYASAALDISDGLIADAAHLASASKLCFEIKTRDIPLSRPTQLWLNEQANQHSAIETLLSAGDDYEIFFTASPRHRGALSQIAVKLGLRLTRIGEAIEGAGLNFLSGGGQAVVFEKTGYKHKI